MVTRDEYIRQCVTEAVDSLDNLTTDSFSTGGDRGAREALVKGLVALGVDPGPREWDLEYPDAVAEAREIARWFDRVEPVHFVAECPDCGGSHTLHATIRPITGLRQWTCPSERTVVTERIDS